MKSYGGKPPLTRWLDFKKNNCKAAFYEDKVSFAHKLLFWTQKAVKNFSMQSHEENDPCGCEK